MRELQLSFIVTSIERDYRYIIDLIDSFVCMSGYCETELIIIFKDLSKEKQMKIESIIMKHDNIQLLIGKNMSRCERKDLGVKMSKSKMLVFLDSDCIIKKDYYEMLKDYLGYKIIRGRNVYIGAKTWFAKMTSIYRTVADEYTFRNETFSPNLVINKELLTSVGGWSKDNIDFSDDYNLSQRIHERYQIEIIHVDKAILYNQPDMNWKKTINTWKQYGMGYMFRYCRSNSNRFVDYIPPFVYKFGLRIDYFFFAIFQWFVTTKEYIRAYKCYKGIK